MMRKISSAGALGSAAMGGWVGAVFVLAAAATISADAWAMGRRSAPTENPKRARTADRLTLDRSERLITFLQTNDIHGGVEAGSIHLTQPKDEVLPFGGASYWSGVVTAIRTGLAGQFGSNAGVAVVDGGDQFQGTLISNYNEGKLVIDVMSSIGYQAVVPGNHDYDFGPAGWLVDQVVPGNPDQNPRGVLEGLVERATFPFVSANTYLRDSIYSVDGEKLDVQPSGCRVKKPAPSGGHGRPGNGENSDDQGPKIDWARSRRPDFLIPFKIQYVAGVRVAMIGIDNQSTPEMTTVQNVSDLCFRDEAETYAEVRQALEGRADIFVLLMHGGDMLEFPSGSRVVEAIQKRGADIRVSPERMVDAVFAGHTHMVNHKVINGAPFIQSGANGELFGRVDLVWDVEKSRLVPEKMRSFAGLKLVYDRCAKQAEPFCTEVDTTVLGAVVKRAAYEGEIARPDKRVERLVAKARGEVEPLASRVMGEADGKLWRDRVFESPLADAMTDALRKLSGAEVAFLNTGGLRAEIEAGKVTYENLFRVLPFGNHALVAGPMEMTKFIALLERSIKSCGAYGPLMQSGLRVEFERNCGGGNTGQPAVSVDKKARLLHVETIAGEVILDVATALVPPTGRTFRVATLDFLMAGGSGFTDFAGTPVIRDLGILREAMATEFLAHPAQFSSKPDGRWKYVQTPARGSFPEAHSQR